jgi:hypothetical protein
VPVAGEIVGSARVRIEADLTGFDRSLQPGVQRAADQAEATLAAAFREAADTAQAALASLADVAAELAVDADVQPLLDQVGVAEAAIEGLATESADVPLDADPDELLQAVAASEAAVDDLAAESATVPLDADPSGLEQALARARAEATDAAEDIEGAFAGTGQAIAAGFTVAAGAATALSAAVIGSGGAFNVLSQQVTTSLTSVLQSRDATNDLVDEVIELNATAAFSPQAFLASTQQLVGFGVAADDVTTTLDAMQQAVVATGGGEAEFEQLTRTLAEVESQGQVTGETLQRLREHGGKR